MRHHQIPFGRRWCSSPSSSLSTSSSSSLSSSNKRRLNAGRSIFPDGRKTIKVQDEVENNNSNAAMMTTTMNTKKGTKIASTTSTKVAFFALGDKSRRKKCFVVSRSSRTRGTIVTKASSSFSGRTTSGSGGEKNENKTSLFQNVPEPYKSIVAIALATVFASLIANSDLSIAFPYLAPVQRGCEIVSVNAIKTLLLVTDGALDTAECAWILLNKMRAPSQEVVSGMIGMLSGVAALIVGAVGAGASAVGAAFAFVTSRIAMYLATLVVWAGTGSPAFVSADVASMQGLSTPVVVAITVGATILIQNAWKMWRGDGIESSSSNTVAEAEVPQPPLKAERVIRSAVAIETPPPRPSPPPPPPPPPPVVSEPVVAQSVVSEVVSTPAVASSPPPSTPRVVDNETEEVRRVFERLKAEAEANANIANLSNKEKRDGTNRVGSKQRFQAFTYLVKETLDSIKDVTNKDADEVLFDAKFQAKEVASITSKKLNETFSDKEQFEERLKRTFKKTTSIANEAVLAATPVFKELSPVLSKSAKRAARQLRKVDVSQMSTSSVETTKFDLPKVEMPEMPKMPKMEKPKVDAPTKEKKETKKVEEKKEESPKPSASSSVIEEKDTKAIEAAKKEAAEKVLKEMAALEEQMSRDVESARDKVTEAEREAGEASTSASSSDDVEILKTADGMLRFSVDDDEEGTVAPKVSGAASSKKLNVPDVELPAGTKVIRDSEDDGDTK